MRITSAPDRERGLKLVGDIGGTKTLLALVDATGRLHHKCRLASAEFADFADLLAEYLHEIETLPDGACLAVAGPIATDGRSAKVTNLPWRIEAAALEARFKIRRLRLINDLAAVARGVMVLSDDDCLTLQPGIPQPDGVKLVLGAGTGLGMAVIVEGRVLPSEGGHVGFSPQDETQEKIAARLRREYDRVTAERVISGPGLENIHRVLAGEVLPATQIVARARQGETTARCSLEAFFCAYGSFAGDMALAVLAFGGVYLAGGVTLHLLSELPESGFLSAFNAKAEHTELARGMPVRVVTDAEIGLKGALAFANESEV